MRACHLARCAHPPLAAAPSAPPAAALHRRACAVVGTTNGVLGVLTFVELEKLAHPPETRAVAEMLSAQLARVVAQRQLANDGRDDSGDVSATVQALLQMQASQRWQATGDELRESLIKRARNSAKERAKRAKQLTKQAGGLGHGKDAAAPHGKAGSDACLLYTSPSPRDGLLSRMPSSA